MYFVHVNILYSLENGSLRLLNITEETGFDIHGYFTSTQWIYGVSTSATKVITEIKRYSKIPLIVFTQVLIIISYISV